MSAGPNAGMSAPVTRTARARLRAGVAGLTEEEAEILCGMLAQYHRHESTAFGADAGASCEERSRHRVRSRIIARALGWADN